MNKMLRIVLSGWLLSLILSLFISCAGGAGGGGNGGDATSLCVTMPIARSAQYKKDDPSEPGNFEIFTVTINSSAYKATKSCGSGESLKFENIPVGHYDVVALAKRSDGTVTAKGTATVDIEADVTKTVTINLTRLYHHTVTFQSKRIDNNPNSGSYMQAIDYTFTQEISDGYKVSKPSDPALEGSVFSLWSTSATEDIPFDFNSPITADTTLYAKWNEITYTVKYVSPLGDFADSTFTAGTASGYSLPSTADISDLTFGGWYSDSDFTTSVNASSVRNLSTFTKKTEFQYEKTIYAKWTVAVIIDRNNGASETRNIAYGKKVSRPESDPEKTGATFGGWYKGTVDNDGKLTLETDAYDFDSTVSEDFAIYAKWIYVSFTGTVAEFLTATLDTTTSGTRTITITDVSDANFSSFTARLNEFSSLRSFNLTLQGTLTEIPANAFKTSNVSCAGNLKTVRLPNTVTKIGNQAFYNSRNLDLIFPTGLEEIGDRAINASLMGSPRRIASLTNLRKIGDLAFMSIGSLSIGADDLTIPASVTEIYSTSFEKSKPFNITFAGNNLWTKYQGDTMIEENVVLGSDDVKYSSGATVYRYVRAAP